MVTPSESRKYILIALLVPLLAFLSIQESYSQAEDRLTLAEVLTALQSKSSGTSLSEKNSYITGRVKARGVTFRSSIEITNELRRAGASQALINAIIANGPRETESVNNSLANNVVFDNLWVSYNVVEEGQKGMRVHGKFSVKNMKGVPLYFTVRVQKENGDILESNNRAFRNKGGQLSVFRKMTPAYDNSVYDDFSAFIPYKEIVLPAGKHNLKLDADIIYENGDFLKHLKTHPILFTQGVPPTPTPTPTPTPAQNPASVKFGRLWIEQNVKSGSVSGMRVHVKFTVYNLTSNDVQLAIGVEKQNGSPVNGISTAFRSKTGKLAVYRELNPKYSASVFNDVVLFIPYKEFDIRPATANLRIHADIIYPTNQNLHITYYNFRLSATGLRLANSVY